LTNPGLRSLLLIGALALAIAGCSNKSPISPTPPASSCTFNVTGAPSGQIAAGAAEFTFTIATQAGCAWTVSSNSPFITATGATSGTGNGSVKFAVQANVGAERQGSIQVAGQTITLQQAAGAPQACDFALNPPSASMSATGGDFTINVTVTRGDNCAWNASANAAFITVTLGATGVGNGTVVLSVAANPGTARSGSATIAGSTVMVNQDALVLVPTPVAVLSFQSDVGDPTGNGQSASYTMTASQFAASIDVTQRALNFRMLSGGSWQLDMFAASGLAPGYYPLAGNGVLPPASLTFKNGATSCSWVNGRFLISELTYTGNTVNRLHARFEQHCNSMSVGLRGEIWIDNTGQTTPPSMAALPAPSAPTTFLTIQSDPGDFVGAGGSATYSLPASVFFQGLDPNKPSVLLTATTPAGITGAADYRWDLYFEGPAGAGNRLLPGTYNPAPKFQISGNFVPGPGRGCSGSDGKFVVLEAVYDGIGAIYRFHATFEYHCNGAVPAIRGEIYIVADPWR